MASTTDPRASGFNAAQFRDAIKFAMNMGLPNTVSERATFRWTPDYTYSTSDPGGTPYDLESTPTATDAPEDVQIDCAVEFVSKANASGGTALGPFDVTRAVITILDTDYSSVAGADQVLLGENTYKVDFVAPPMGLFEVTIYQVYCTAVDES
jgi:hypothetical protein